MRTLGEKLTDLRIANNMKAIDVAKTLNIPQSNFSKYENDSKKPNIETLVKFCKFYNVSMDFLCDLTPINFNNDLVDKPFCEGNKILVGEVMKREYNLSEESKLKLLDYIKMLEIAENSDK